MRLAVLILILVGIRNLGTIAGAEWSGYDVLARGPVAQVDDAAAFAAEGKLRIIPGDFFATDRALHTAGVGDGDFGIGPI